MSALSRVILAFSQADPDKAAASSLALGFGQVGAEVQHVARTAEALALLAGSHQDLVVTSLRLEGEDGLALVKAVRGTKKKVPVLVLGDAARRKEVMGAGATDFFNEPAYVRDVVTLARFHTLPRKGDQVTGDLEMVHLYHLVRALSAAGRTGVLFLLRGGRRGELRFHQGELTSAELGLHHGLAAFHHLLLWYDARFDWRTESVVRRQQIPLTPAELAENTERFLRDFQEMSCGVSPSMIFELDLKRLGELSDWVPKEAQNITQLFDGRRTLADVIEDCPIRLPDTMRVAVKLIEVGVLKKVDAPRTISNPTAALVVEDWLVGQAQPQVSVPAAPPAAPPPPPPAMANEWGKLDGSAQKEYAPVVPAKAESGEIAVPPVPPELDATVPVPLVAEPAAAPPAPAPPAPAPPPPKRAATPAPTRAATPLPLSGGPKVLGKSTGPKSTVKGKDTGKHKAHKESGRHKALRHFEDHEQAFFDEEQRIEAEHAAESGDDFSDLDDHTAPRVGFWRRLWQGIQRKPIASPKSKR